jgi:hypothetical protein
MTRDYKTTNQEESFNDEMQQLMATWAAEFIVYNKTPQELAIEAAKKMAKGKNGGLPKTKDGSNDSQVIAVANRLLDSDLIALLLVMDIS